MKKALLAVALLAAIAVAAATEGARHEADSVKGHGHNRINRRSNKAESKRHSRNRPDDRLVRRHARQKIADSPHDAAQQQQQQQSAVRQRHNAADSTQHLNRMNRKRRDQKKTGVSQQACQKQLKAWDQCGGKTNCPAGQTCGAQAWSGTCCTASKCVCGNEWYCQCQPDGGNSNSGGSNGGGNNNGGNSGGSTQPNDPSQYKPDPPVPAKKYKGDYDYGQVLGLSFLFYEAQRSGKLPANNRIKWRGNSGLDHTYNGRDVTGGWYDAGDNVKFNLPMAWSTAAIAWSIVEFKKGFVDAGQYSIALGNIKWVTDYFIKCVGDGTEVVVQVGNGAQDHAIWGRPEDIKGPVPAYAVTKDKPGSDAVGAMGAALAAAAVAFKGVDNAYSAQLVNAATKAYNFASKYLGKYSESVSDAANFYRSSNYMDDIAFNALWLYQATGNAAYKQAGYDWYMKHYKQEDGAGVWDNYDWDSNSWGAVVLLNRYYPTDTLIKGRIDGFIKSWTQGSNWVQFTPKGLAYSGPWGSLRHVGNALFLMKAYTNGAKNLPSSTKSQIDCAVKKQLGYILGNTGRSFVVGYGTTPPQRPHHRASSCPPLGVPCTWDYFNNPGPNPHTLYGALVGGPGSSDNYADLRNDYIMNEVATDYNAGFTGALAAAKQGLSCAAKAESLVGQQPTDSAGQGVSQTLPPVQQPAEPPVQDQKLSNPANPGDDKTLMPDQQPAVPSTPADQQPHDSAEPIQQPRNPVDIAPPSTPVKQTDTCQVTLKAWDQCGGKSGCSGDKCGDGSQPWTGYCCPLGYTCKGNDVWYRSCQQDMSGGGGSNTGGNNNGGGGSGPISYKPDPPVPAKMVNGGYDYGQLLDLSFMFYEAQRSGKLPATNRIKWRGDSGLNDAYNGRDVTGGWYDAGDNVKFNLPMAWSTAVLAWSMVDFAKGYQQAGEMAIALDNLKWATDYFIKCVGNGTEVVVQVGNGNQDHAVWGRPEDVIGPVPAYAVTQDKPGSDAVGAMGAALAAAAVAFKSVDSAYSAQLVDAATKAYNFASKYLGKYSDSVSDAANFYRSSNYMDDIAFNALWLYQATGNAAYKQAGYDWYMKHYQQEDGPGVWDNYDWDSNSWGAVVLLNRLFPNDTLIQGRINGFIKSWTQGSNWVQFTPKGLAYSGPWGSLRHVGNALFLMKAYLAKAQNAPATVRSSIDCTVKKQLGYILGDTGRSFVVGYGTNPPQRPHHRASSCPPLGQPCGWDYFNNPGPNPHTLYGALVGGPGSSDNYADLRNDYIMNEVATDYNAGFTGALAAAEEGLQCSATLSNTSAAQPTQTSLSSSDSTAAQTPSSVVSPTSAELPKPSATAQQSAAGTPGTPVPQPATAVPAPQQTSHWQAEMPAKAAVPAASSVQDNAATPTAPTAKPAGTAATVSPGTAATVSPGATPSPVSADSPTETVPAAPSTPLKVADPATTAAQPEEDDILAETEGFNPADVQQSATAATAEVDPDHAAVRHHRAARAAEGGDAEAAGQRSSKKQKQTAVPKHQQQQLRRLLA